MPFTMEQPESTVSVPGHVIIRDPAGETVMVVVRAADGPGRDRNNARFIADVLNGETPGLPATPGPWRIGGRNLIEAMTPAGPELVPLSVRAASGWPKQP